MEGLSTSDDPKRDACSHQRDGGPCWRPTHTPLLALLGVQWLAGLAIAGSAPLPAVSRAWIALAPGVLFALGVWLSRRADKACEEGDKNDCTEERRLLSTIVDTLPLPVFWKDRDLSFLGCNQAFADAIGLDNPEQVVGLNDYDLPATKEQAAWYQRCDRDVMEKGVPLRGCEETLRLADGEEIVLSTSKTPLRDSNGRVIGVVGVFADITEQQRISKDRARLLHELSDRQALLEGIFETAPDAIVIVDRDERILRANRYAERAFRVPPGGLQGRRFSECIGSTGESRPAHWVTEFLDDRAKTQANAERVEALRADGEAFDAELTVSRVGLEERVLYTCILRDVTDREQLESQLAQAQKLESIGQLAAGVAHEINTPMQFVRDNVEFLIDGAGRLLDTIEGCQAMLDCDADSPIQERWADLASLTSSCRLDYIREEFQPAVDETREGIERVISIVRAMKECSHPGDQATSLVDINHAARSTAAVTRNRWKYSAQLVLELADEPPQAWGYPAEINQVILNLLVNAADAVAARHGEEPENGRIWLRTRTEGDSAIVEIQDNGCGIPAEIRSRVFDHFFTTKEVGKGTGQGLALAHNVIVGKHGGRITFRSEEGVGTTFLVAIPLSRATPSLTEPLEASLQETHSGNT